MSQYSWGQCEMTTRSQEASFRSFKLSKSQRVRCAGCHSTPGMLITLVDMMKKWKKSTRWQCILRATWGSRPWSEETIPNYFVGIVRNLGGPGAVLDCKMWSGPFFSKVNMWRNHEKIHYATSNGWRTTLHDLQHQKRKKVFNQTFDFSWSVIFFGFPHVCGEMEASNCDLRVLRKLKIIRLQCV